jgi:hypothetical protein
VPVKVVSAESMAGLANPVEMPTKKLGTATNKVFFIIIPFNYLMFKKYIVAACICTH